MPLRGRGPGTPYRKLQSVRFLLSRDRNAVLRFLGDPDPRLPPRRARLALLRRFLHITHEIRGYHTQAEMVVVAQAILRRRAPVVVECGAAKGSSSAKLGLATAAAGGRLHVFDSFRGIPENAEVHRNLDGRTVRFRKGAFTGRLRSVERTVTRFGAPEITTLTKGWFEDTLPAFAAPRIDVLLLDVDLLSSTETCLRHLFGQLAPDGICFSQDGHLEAIVARLGDPAFWRDEVGVEPPEIEGLGRDKFLVIRPAGRPTAGAPRT